MTKIQSMLLLVAFVSVGVAHAQAPTGTIAGVVRDPSGAVVTGAQVRLVSLATGLTRPATTSEQGDYSFPALLAGEYDLSTEVQGFRRIVRLATVEAGATKPLISNWSSVGKLDHRRRRLTADALRFPHRWWPDHTAPSGSSRMAGFRVAKPNRAFSSTRGTSNRTLFGFGTTSRQKRRGTQSR
jgi:hypothetical protein